MSVCVFCLSCYLTAACACRSETDPLFKLEHQETDKKAATDSKDHLDELLAVRGDQYEDDYRASRLVRSSFRKRKNEDIAIVKANRERSIYVPLLPEDPRDVKLAAVTAFGKSRAGPVPRVVVKKTDSIFGTEKKKPK